MLPLIARATEEVLLLVPSTLREGSMALGASRTRTVLTVILPTAVGGIVTATIVAIARAAGETAPLLFTCFDLRQHRGHHRPAAGDGDASDRHLQQLGVTERTRSAGCVGGSARADCGGADRKHRRQAALGEDETADRACSVTGGFDDHTNRKGGRKDAHQDKSGIIDSMSDDVSESKNPEADVVGEPGLALARSQAKLAEMAGEHGSSPQDGRRVVSAWTTCP